MHTQCFYAIVAAGGGIPALGTDHGRYYILIKTNQHNKRSNRNITKRFHLQAVELLKAGYHKMKKPFQKQAVPCR